jgi:hypothetical protein
MAKVATQQMTRALDDVDDVVACRLDAAQRADRGASLAELFGSAQEKRELRDGYALRFPGDAAHVRALANAIILERDCCPFLAFDLTLEPHGGPIWLRVTGPAGTKAFLRPLIAAAMGATGPTAS